MEIRGKHLLLLAKVRERSGNIKGALSTLKEAKDNQNKYIQRAATSADTTTRKKSLTQICLYMAEHATALREFDQAIDYYKEALSYKPNDITALLSLAKLYMQVIISDLLMKYIVYNLDPLIDLFSITKY